MKEVKAAFIGCGAMGGALARAVKKSRAYKADVAVTAAHYEHAVSFAKKYSCRAASSNAEAVKGCDVVFIAVKPHDAEAVVREAGKAMPPSALLVSMAAGVNLERIMQWTSCPCARIMPNVGAAASQSMTAVCCGKGVTEAQKEMLFALLGSAGLVREVDEVLMPIVTAVSGSGPAFVFMFIEALADAAVRGGMKRADACTFASQTVLGAGTLALKGTPAALKDAVCSPAGTTIEGVAALEARGFRGSVMVAVEAAFKKA